MLPRGAKGNRLCLNSPLTGQSARGEIAQALTKERKKGWREEEGAGKQRPGFKEVYRCE